MTSSGGDGDHAFGNKLTLWVAMVSFSLFAAAEFVASLVGNSEALLGDALTMMVDGITYGVNLWAEKKKEGKTERAKIWLDITAPAVSIAALLAVTVYITIMAVKELDESPSEGDEANATVMWAFATVNLVLDFVNLAMFIIKKDDNGRYFVSCSCCRCHSPPDEEQVTDLNMMSALAHVGADTLRSVAVMVAGIAADVGAISSTRADAEGGIVVSIAIVLSVLPLIGEIRGRFRALKDLDSDEAVNALLLESRDDWISDDDDDIVVYGDQKYTIDAPDKSSQA